MVCKLSNREQQILEELLVAKPSVIAIDLGISKEHIATVKSRVRRKEAKAKKLLNQLKRYRTVLYPKKQYKGV